ncbi:MULTISPECIES: multicopper oxidase family protein [unclassified Streptomyces]|uniref:multicopper oxidase family protein n=1 Tax=unclassified Streptomyces TaxID=2593676 RepID=UPI000938A4ED|nr:multicopper oxidase family protein [Streptomyces sp. TSRI0107]OKJ90864.1 copper oxidase [Streptomyces sp. TSRI0107]
MSLSRRRFLGALGVTSTGLILPFAAGCNSGGDGEGVIQSGDVPLPERFTLAFKRPPVIKPTSSEGTTDYFDVRAHTAKVEILPGVQTEIFGYNGTFPGPTFEVRKGRTAVVRTRNDLPVPIVTHLHGGKTPAESDGYPTDLLLPTSGWTASAHQHHSGVAMEGTTAEGTRNYTYPNAQRAATLWYHDHRMDFTGPQVWRGLAGLYIVRDAEEDALPLPKGDRDIPVMIMDRAFDSNGALSYPSIDPTLKTTPGVTGDAHNGMTGDVILVNGVPWPRLQVPGARHRLRLVNASNSRRYRIKLDPEPPSGEPFTLVASDGGLLAKPQEMDSVYMVPGERFDVIVNFGLYAPGTKVTMENSLGDGSTAEVMQFVVGDRITDNTSVPATLSTLERLDPAKAVRTRSFTLARNQENGHYVYKINGYPFSTDRSWADVKRGEIEIWEFSSTTHHPIHLHLSPFQVYKRGGSTSVNPEDVGWKDTARMMPNEKLSLLVRFDDHTGKFVFHCHNLEHEDMAMMANFRVS